jgi:hypothetical protein
MDLTVFIAVTAAAVLLQAGILVAMFIGVRKTSAKMEALAEEVRTKLLPTIETTRSMLTELRPGIESSVANIRETTALVHAQSVRLDATINDLVDRTRLQIIRADEMVTRTLDRVEDATEKVHRTVVSPIRQVSGVIQGLTAGLEFLVAGKRRRSTGDGVTVPQDEMFI